MPDMGYKSLGGILAAIAANFRQGLNTQPGFKAHATEAVNQALEMAADAQEWPELGKNTDLLLTVQGDADTDTMKLGSTYFVAPWDAARVDSIAMNTPTRYSMSEVSREQMLHMMTGFSPGSTGQPKYFTQWGRTAQHVALAAEGALTVLSDSTLNSSDESNLRVGVTYKQAGHHLGESRLVYVEGDFDTGVALPVDAVLGWPIESVDLPSGWAGTLTIQDASANVIVDLPTALLPNSAATTSASRYARQLYRTEVSTDSDRGGYMSWRTSPRRLSADSDIPDIPCAKYLIDMATAILWGSRGAVVQERLFAAKADEYISPKAGSKKKRNKVAAPMFGNIVGMTGTVER